jgi:hypothetical protein
MDISGKFVGNFIFKGLVTDANSIPINGCNVKLFRENDDNIVQVTTTNTSGIFIFTLPNDSYKRYYMVAKRTDIANTAGVTSYIITPAQV